MRRQLRDTKRRGNAFVSRCSLLCLSIALIVSSARLVSGQRWPVAQDATLRRITVSNDDGDVYVESSGDGSEIVLKTEKVRITDGDVYCGTSNVGLSAQIDALKIKDDAFDARIDTLNDTQIGLRDDLDSLETSTSGRLTSIDTALTSLASADASLSAADASLSSRIDALNATDAQLKATDESLATRIATLNATDTALKGVDDDLSSRIDALRDIYVNELNVTDKQLIVTDATLGSRIDDLNATHNELKSADAALSSRIATLEAAHTEYERIDDEVASLIESLNATDATMQAKDASLSDRINALNSTAQALSSTDAVLASQIASLMPPKCTSPGGIRLHYDGEKWTCVCLNASYVGESCEPKGPDVDPSTVDFETTLPYSPWCQPTSVYVPSQNAIFILGGVSCSGDGWEWSQNSGSYLTHVALLNLTDFTWKRLANMSTGRADPGLAVVESSVVACGGQRETSVESEYVTASCEAYDFTDDSWSDIAPLPDARKGPACANIENTSKVVCGGGYRPGAGYGTSFTRNVWEIDLSSTSPSWVELSSLNTKGIYFPLISYEKKYYAPGGYDVTTVLDSMETYDSSVNSPAWVTDTMPDARLSNYATMGNDDLFVFGGVQGGSPGARLFVSTYLKYSVSTQVWSETDVSNVVDLRMGSRGDSLCETDGIRCGDAIWFVPGTGIRLFMPVNESTAVVRTIIDEVSCDASTPPVNGKIGNCTKSLPNGSTCHPMCDEGYHLIGATSCTRGQLESATCVLSPLWSNATITGTITSPPYSPWCRMSNVAMGRYMYVFGGLAGGTDGGCGNPNLTTKSYGARFDPVSGEWQVLSDMPTSRVNAVLIPLNEKVIVAIGGAYEFDKATDAVETYDVTSDSWDSVLSFPNLPSAREMIACSEWRGKIVCAGGYNSQQGGYGGGSKSDAWILDTTSSNPAWDTLPSLQTARREHTLVISAAGVAYAIGGASGNMEYRSTESLNLEDAGGSWQTAGDLPSTVAARDPYSIAIGEEVYGLFFVKSGASRNPHLLRYSAVSGGWETVVDYNTDGFAAFAQTHAPVPTNAQGASITHRRGSMYWLFSSDTAATPVFAIMPVYPDNLVHRFDFSSTSNVGLSLDGSVVESFVDARANANAMQVFGSPKYVTNVQAGLNAINFTADGMYLQFTASGGSEPEVFIVYRVLTYKSGGLIFCHATGMSGSYGVGTYQQGQADRIGMARSSGGSFAGADAPYDSWHVANVYFGSSDGFLNIDDGMSVVTFATSGQYTADALTNVQIGGAVFGGHDVPNLIGEVWVFDSQLSSAQRDWVTNSLISKWNLDHQDSSQSHQ